jgi:starch phosphorylase
MKDAIRLNCPSFNTARMVGEYALRAYFPASDRYRTMTADQYAPAKDLAHWKSYLFEHWYDIRIDSIDVSASSDVKVDQTIGVKAQLRLGVLSQNDIRVELYQGTVDAAGEIDQGVPVVMDYQGQDPQNSSISTYMANIAYGNSGIQGFSLRVLPKHKNLSSAYEPGLILWAS